ncbi:hypothetical protein K443DRAFT_555291 [Laccaria amethystina LaAM-08-1]|uniref:Unplaced genomic scaffold K443scaffold_69, whole genome shotgun sequence n=1 Tax=Laccaria amethystina LaAM-08-1 TaxID=1095629 RepID=A0A0C9WS83_9AGAR|nr:hypothetical protein K443DRAFT_555291 [Laccaria amethystina LaAM-08-1]
MLKEMFKPFDDTPHALRHLPFQGSPPRPRRRALGGSCPFQSPETIAFDDRFMFMRHIPTTPQDLEARSVAVVVEFSQRSNRFKLPDTDSTFVKGIRKGVRFGLSISFVQK